ncbi:MAG: HAMP domain-containing sensor histidine kinase [Bacteroidales bacterium]
MNFKNKYFIPRIAIIFFVVVYVLSTSPPASATIFHVTNFYSFNSVYTTDSNKSKTSWKAAKQIEKKNNKQTKNPKYSKEQQADFNKTIQRIDSINPLVEYGTIDSKWNSIKEHMDSASFFPKVIYYNLYSIKFLHLYQNNKIDSIGYYFNYLKDNFHESKQIPSFYYFYLLLGEAYRSNDQTDKVLEVAKNMRISAENKNYLLGVGYSGYLVATIYKSTGLNKEAIKNYEEILPIFKNSKNWHLYFPCTINLINTLVDNNNLEKAEEYFMSANSALLKLNSDNAKDPTIFMNKINLWGVSAGELFFATKEPDKLLLYITKAEKLAKTHSGFDTTNLFPSKYKYYHLKGNKERTLFYLNKLIHSQTKENNTSNLVALYDEKADIEASLNLYKSAYISSRNYSSLKDSLITSSSKKRLDLLASKNNLSQIKLEKRELEIKSKDQILNLTLILLVITIALSLIIFYFWLVTKKMNSALEKSNNKQYDFIRNMHHEIRTPLNSILGFSEIICSNLKTKEEQKMGKTIRNSGDSLLRMVDNMLLLVDVDSDFLKKNSDTYQVKLKETNIKSCVDRAIKECLPLKNEEIKLVCDFSETIKPENISLISDSFRITKILTEILNNAFIFTKKGQVKIDIKDSYDHVSISVSDTGKGIADNIKDNLFDPFIQADNFSNGLGIGLSVCKELAKDINVTITLDRNYTKGAKFDIYIQKN